MGSEAKSQRKEKKKICKFQEEWRKKEDRKFPHVPEELLKDLTPPYTTYATNVLTVTGRNVATYTGSKLKTTKGFLKNQYKQ